MFLSQPQQEEPQLLIPDITAWEPLVRLPAEDIVRRLDSPVLWAVAGTERRMTPTPSPRSPLTAISRGYCITWPEIETGFSQGRSCRYVAQAEGRVGGRQEGSCCSVTARNQVHIFGRYYYVGGGKKPPFLVGITKVGLNSNGAFQFLRRASLVVACPPNGCSMCGSAIALLRFNTLITEPNAGY